MSNRFPHRFAPMGGGPLDGTTLACGYRGLKINAQGICILNPHANSADPLAVKVERSPILNRYGFIWVWIGAVDAANIDRIPDLSFLNGSPSTATPRGGVYSKINDLQRMDNRLTTVRWPLCITGLKLRGRLPPGPTGTEINRKMSSLWKWQVEHGYDFHKGNQPPGPANTYMATIWYAPSINVLLLNSSGRSLPRDAGVGAFAVHLHMPETDLTLNYSCADAGNLDIGNQELMTGTEKVLLLVDETEYMPMVQTARGGNRRPGVPARQPCFAPA